MSRLLFLSCLIFLNGAASAETIFKKIQSMNMASLEFEEEEWPNEPFKEYLLRCLDYQLHMQAAKKRRIVFRVFDQVAAQQPQIHNSLYDMTTAADLNLFCGKKSEA